MNILLWIVFGGLAGWLAGAVMSTDLGLIMNVVVGIVGAFVGGFIADKVNFKEGTPGADRPTDVWGFLWAVVGAVILLFLANLLFA